MVVIQHYIHTHPCNIFLLERARADSLDDSDADQPDDEDEDEDDGDEYDTPQKKTTGKYSLKPHILLNTQPRQNSWVIS